MERVAWITGAGGLIGSYIARATRSDWRAIPLIRETLELTDFSAVRARFEVERPQLVIHCAAMSKSPVCQANPALAWKVNVDSHTVSHRIQMHVIADRAEVAVAPAVHHERFVAPAEQVAEEFVPAIKARRAGAQKPFHAATRLARGVSTTR